MKCQQFEQIAGDYFDGSLEPEKAIEVERHAAICGECSGMFADLRYTLVAIDDAPFLNAPDALVDSILARTATERGALAVAGGGSVEGLGLRGFFGAFLHPRLALSMAMAVLSLSLLTWFGQRSYQDWRARGDAAPAFVTGLSNGIEQSLAEGRRVIEDVDYQLRLHTELGDLSDGIGASAFVPAGAPTGKKKAEAED